MLHLIIWHFQLLLSILIILPFFQINDYDDEMLIPVNSMVDGYSKSGMDNPVALGPDQGYPNVCNLLFH